MNLVDELFLKRCFDLAQLGKAGVAPNPMVGAVVVHQGRIIGEGYHKKYGQAHAEVNAVNSIQAFDRHLLSKSTIYINLEPCCIHGNTPPCTDLIIKNKIPRVVFSCIDQTAGVLGNSIRILRAAGCEVITGVLKEEGEKIIAPRTVFTTQKRPFVILKYAESADGFIGKTGQQIWLSNSVSKRLVHKWRSETSAIMVGTNTAATDNPKLDNRFYFGTSPLRIVLDRQLRLDQRANLFDQSIPTWVITEAKRLGTHENLKYIHIPFDENLLPTLLTKLYQQKIGILMVEGGSQLLNGFIEQELWDEIRVFKTKKMLHSGIKAPGINLPPNETHPVNGDQLLVFRR